MLRFVAVAAVLSALAGCLLVMGDTSGYSLPTCASAADCHGGQVCCVTVQNNAPVVSCMASCPALSIQLCEAGSECPNDAGCAKQTCDDASAMICGSCPLGP